MLGLRLCLCRWNVEQINVTHKNIFAILIFILSVLIGINIVFAMKVHPGNWIDVIFLSIICGFSIYKWANLND